MKMFRRVMSFALAFCMMLSLTPAVAKADSAYTMITPGLSADAPAIVPVDGKDYVAKIDSGDTEYLYFAFDVTNSNSFYTVTYMNLSVEGRTEYTLETAVGEVLYQNNFVNKSVSCKKNRKFEQGRYILKVHNYDKKTGNIKVNVASSVDKVGDDMAHAQAIKLGASVTGSLDGYCDNDYYKFVAPAKGTYEFYGKNLSIDDWCYFAVYSSSEERMYDANCMHKNDDASCAIKCAKGDVYYLQYSYTNTREDPIIGKYKVCVKKVAPGKVKTVKVTKKNSFIYANWSKASDCTGYEMQISTSKKFKTYDSYTTSDKNYSVYRSKGTYYIRVRSYKLINNQKYYGSFSSIKKITIK